MAPTLLFLVLLCSSTALITSTNGVAAAAGAGGGTGLRMKLTHVDANGNYTVAELFRRAIVASKERLAFLDAFAGGGVGMPVHWATLQYVAEYLIGDPPQRAAALIDTGSDLIWTQCSTCLRKVCARQTLPYYNSSASNTFAAVPCAARSCAAASDIIHFCDLAGGCSVIAGYGAGVVAGSLGTDKFSFQSGSTALAFGCVTFTRIINGALQGASGIIGLGRGELSLVSQIGATRFSYCLTRYFHHDGENGGAGGGGHLFVGGAAASLGGEAVARTAFVKGPKGSPFYYLPLVGLTVGNTRLPIPSTAFDFREIAPGFMAGGVIIDSGTPFTSLVRNAYDALANELSARLNGSLVPAPGGDADTLCVARRDVARVVPRLVFHFRGGADMVLPPENYWAPVDKAAATACLAIVGAGYRSVIGNFQQQNMHVLYDLANAEFSFQPADCTALQI
uniref:Peptidase A1 domain-containing protein n=1 Tax=Leersia perrieri TaxID=77586 RepID=A0A0D9Y0X4_9ORYZ